MSTELSQYASAIILLPRPEDHGLRAPRSFRHARKAEVPCAETQRTDAAKSREQNSFCSFKCVVVYGPCGHSISEFCFRANFAFGSNCEIGGHSAPRIIAQTAFLAPASPLCASGPVPINGLTLRPTWSGMRSNPGRILGAKSYGQAFISHFV